MARTGRDGFSMVEILAVLVILGMIAALVSVNMEAILPRAQLHSTVREIAAMIQGARADAISRNAVFKIEYDLDRHRYRKNTPFRLGGGLAPTEEERVAFDWIEMPPSVRFDRIQIDGVEYSSGMVFVRFDPLGAASGHIVRLVQNPHNQRYTIEVQALTGTIDYHEGVFDRTPAEEGDFQ